MLSRAEILNWLLEPDPIRLEWLWREADEVRRRHVGDAVHLRGLIEISNFCVRLCGYCGIRAPNSAIERYRMETVEIVDAAHQARAFGYGTVVLQAGEDPKLTGEFVSDVIWRIKRETSLAITLSLGERSEDELRAWRNAGADRYLLRFETSNRMLFDAIHPPRGAALSDRVAQLRAMRELGYEIGSGVMIGIPGQSFEDLASDIELFRELDLDMIGCGPFIAHPGTPLGQAVRRAVDGQVGGESAGAAGSAMAPGETGDGGAGGRAIAFLPDQRATAARAVAQPRSGSRDQVPATETMTYKVVALARLVCPRANIPSTTALATLNRDAGRELGLQRGANIVMPNLTPPRFRAKYEIYPAKACLFEDAAECHECMEKRIRSIGRQIGEGRGDSPNRLARTAAGDGGDAGAE